jgi:GTP-binding protein
MRREGYELAVGKPQVLKRVVDGVTQEPFEALTIDIDEGYQGGVMSELGTRRGELLDMTVEGDPTGRGQGRVRLEYRIPARGLIGFQGEFMTMTRGTGLMSHIFDGYDVVKGEIPERHNGVLISNEEGTAVAYALFTLQERGRLFVEHGSKVYEGMIIGIHSRDNDLVVNPIKEKKLTNVRAAGKDDALLLTPPIPLSLEYAVEFINEDELVEVTPESIRLRKRFLKEHERKRASRDAEG